MDSVPELNGVRYDRDLPVFDPGHFDGIFDPGDPAARKTLLSEIFGLFREEAGSRVAALDSISDKATGGEFREAVHFIAGSAANLGMARLAGLCRGVEQAILEGTAFDRESCRTAVLAEYEAACAAFSVDPLAR